MGVVKINVDAAVGKNQARGSVAAVVRSASGEFLGASAVVFPGCVEAEMPEALACREALALAKDIDARRIRVASDCLNVIRNIKDRSKGTYAHIIQEISKVSSGFEKASFCHERRGLNKEAHSLARSVVHEEQGRRVWFFNPPYGHCIPINIMIYNKGVVSEKTCQIMSSKKITCQNRSSKKRCQKILSAVFVFLSFR
jgi:ribonuclease HI